MELNEDPQSDESENAVLLHTIRRKTKQHSSIKYTLNDKMPLGKRFTLESDEHTYGWTPRCKTYLCILLFVACVLLGASWMMTQNELLATIISWLAFSLLFIFVIYLLSMLILKIILCNKERWTTFVLVINVETNAFYVIDQSSYKRWEISNIGALNQLNICVETEKKCKDKTYVMIDKTKFNTKWVRLAKAQHFIELIEDYLSRIYRNEYLNEQFIKGDVLAMAKRNNASEDRAYEMEMLNKGLSQVINGLMHENDIQKVMEGERLNEWRQRENEALVYEYQKLVKQQTDERERFRKYMNFEPRFNEDYIAKMLLVKCNVFQILSD